MQRLRLPFCLVVLLTALPAQGALAVTTPLADCARHHGVLSQRHDPRALLRAYERTPAEVRVASDCAQSIASQLAVRFGSGGHRVADVYRDCIRHGGRLTRRYDRRTLRRAQRRMPPGLKAGTRCWLGIPSQLLALGVEEVAFHRPVRRPTALDTAPAADVEAAIAPVTAALRRPRRAGDALPPSVASYLSSNADAGFRTESSRRIGPPSRRFWLVVAVGRVCVARQYPRAIAVGCDLASRYLAGVPLLTVGFRPDGRYEFYGAAPDVVAAPALVYGSGRARPIALLDGGFLELSPRLASALEWRGEGGAASWLDTSLVPCPPRTSRCIQVPSVNRR